LAFLGNNLGNPILAVINPRTGEPTLKVMSDNYDFLTIHYEASNFRYFIGGHHVDVGPTGYSMLGLLSTDLLSEEYW